MKSLKIKLLILAGILLTMGGGMSVAGDGLSGASKDNEAIVEENGGSDLDPQTEEKKALSTIESKSGAEVEENNAAAVSTDNISKEINDNSTALNNTKLPQNTTQNLAENREKNKYRENSTINTQTDNKTPNTGESPEKQPEKQPEKTPEKEPQKETPNESTKEKSGHFEKVWVVDEKAYIELVTDYEPGPYVCTACSFKSYDYYEIYDHGFDMLRAGDNAHTFMNSPGIRTVREVKHEEVGHFEEVWVED